MKIYKIQSHEVWTNTDTTEGRGRQVLIARFKYKDDAMEFAKDKGVMGTPADVKWNEEEIRIFESMDDLKESRKCLNKKKQILGKKKKYSD